MRKWVVRMTAIGLMSGCASEEGAAKDVAVGVEVADGNATVDSGTELDGADSAATSAKGT